MRKVNIGLLLLTITTSSMYAKNIVLDNLNETKHINISRSDINRFVFPAPIKTQISSKEKDLLVTTTGNEMFVKFSPYQEQEEVQVGGKTVTQGTSTIVYNKAKVNEIFVVTENKTYSFTVTGTVDGKTYTTTIPKITNEGGFSVSIRATKNNYITKQITLTNGNINPSKTATSKCAGTAHLWFSLLRSTAELVERRPSRYQHLLKSGFRF